MVKLRNRIIIENSKQKNNEKEIIEQLAININWIESYADEIISLQKMFLKLSMKIPEFYEQIEKIINEKQIKYEISDRNPKYTSIVNEAFFLSMDSILRIITSKEEIYNLSLDEFFDLINTNREILQDALQLENNLNLRSKEAFSLQEILKLINAFYLNKLASIENVQAIIKYFGEQTTCAQNNMGRALCDNLKSFYQFLIGKLGNLPMNKNFNFYKVLSVIFLNEYIKITNPEFRKILLQTILENNDLIKNCSQIIKIILENVISCNPSEIKENLSLIEENNSEAFKSLNNSQNVFLDEIIMNILEGKISVYFELIPKLGDNEMKTLFPKYYTDNKKTKNITGIVFDNSFEIFKEAIEFLDSFSTKKKNNNLCKLYSIVYTKMYLSKLVFMLKEKYQEMGDIQNIMKVIKSIKNKNFSKVIKLYILKLFFNLSNNFEEFKNYNFEKVGIDFIKEFSTSKQTQSNEMMLTHFFLPLDEEDYKKYLEELKLFIKNNNFDLDQKEIGDSIKKDGIDTFLLVTINKIISNLGLLNYETKEKYTKFSLYAKSLFNDNAKLNISKELKELLFLFYDSKIYIEKMKPNLIDEKKMMNQKVFEALLYGFRYCVNTLSNNNENGKETFLFQSLLSKNCSNVIEQSFIPGNDNKEDLHITTLESIEFHFKTFPDACGCYVCSCGLYYNIDPCGFPTTNRTFDCSVCGQKCGWDKKKVKGGASNHGMVVRPGHYRLFRDKAQKEGQMRRWKDPDENIPNMLLADYKKQVIDPIRKKSAFGFNSIDRDYFEKQDKKVRNLSIIGYRLLNFISYCYLFFNYCLGNITKENLNKYLIQNTNILRIIEIDWDLLKESLQSKGIGYIQIFMNMIFKRLSNLIKECKILKIDADRENFEKQVEELISQCIKEYPNYSVKYNEENKSQSELDINSLKTLVTELVPPSAEFYSEKEYPMFKYFNLTKYKSEDDLLKRMNNREKYPLLNQLISGNPVVKKLSNLPAFNEFTNYMVENYSFKISRDDARKRELRSEEIFNTKEFSKKFDGFIKAWNEIKSEAKKYKCRPEMPEKNLSSNDKLICFLNDCGELYNGMYLSSACQNFIEWQNTFLQPIADANAFNGILHCYVDNIIKKVPVQNAKHEQILLFNERFLKSKYIDLNDVIYSFSERNIFNDKEKINYSDYNSFSYDYDAIEEELGKIILPGVCLFEGEDQLNFITFWGEGFRGGKSDMLSNFYSKYSQKDLDDKEKEGIIEYIDKMNKSKILNNNDKYDFKEFFGSMQLLIFYLTEKGIRKDEDRISDILSKAPGYLKLSDDCKDFFLDEGKELTVNKIMNLFFFFEHLCFEDLVETLQPEYKKEIPEDLKKIIINKLLKKEKDPNEKYTTKDLAAAVRRFISRYLAGKLETTDINEENDLAFNLTRLDLWEEKISKLEDLDDIITNQLYEFKLKVGQAYAFYNLIGEEDRNSIENKNKEEKKEIKENNEIEIIN